ncbi:MAG: MFS transporter, partial [Corynebacterium flavescens]
SNHTASRFVDALKNVQVHVMALAYFGIMCGIYATTFWMPTILKENGIENNTVNGLLTALPYFVTIPVMVLLTRSSDKSQDRFWHALVPTLLAAMALVAAAVLSANFWISYLALCVAVFSVWGAYTVFWAVPSKAFGGTAAAGGIAYINTMGILGGFVAPMIIGFVKTATGSTEGGLLTMVGLLILSAGALVVLKRVLFDKEKAEAPVEL